MSRQGLAGALALAAAKLLSLSVLVNYLQSAFMSGYSFIYVSETPKKRLQELIM